jgi:MFS family permease
MGFPLGMSAAAESGPDPAARISVVASIGYFANLAGPPAIGALAQSAGLLSALWLVVVLFLAAFAAAGALRPRPAARPPAKPQVSLANVQPGDRCPPAAAPPCHGRQVAALSDYQ